MSDDRKVSAKVVQGNDDGSPKYGQFAILFKIGGDDEPISEEDLTRLAEALFDKIKEMEEDPVFEGKLKMSGNPVEQFEAFREACVGIMQHEMPPNVIRALRASVARGMREEQAGDDLPPADHPAWGEPV